MTTTTNILNSIRTASPAAAFAAGVRAILPVLLALLPFGATAAGIGFSPIETLGMSVFVAAGAAVSAGAVDFFIARLAALLCSFLVVILCICLPACL